MYRLLIIVVWLPPHISYIIPVTSEICDWDIYSCYVPYDIRFSYKFICSSNEQCPPNFKCCRHRCFVHNICQPYKQITVPPQKILKNTVFHPGECNILLNCDTILPESFVRSFECQEDDDCPVHFKCCYLECYKHKICQPAKNEHIYVETVVKTIDPTTTIKIVPSIVFESVTRATTSTEVPSLSAFIENPSTLGTPSSTIRKQELTTGITPNVTTKSLSTLETTEMKITSIENTGKSIYSSRTESTTKKISDDKYGSGHDNNVNIPVTSTPVIITTATNDARRETTTKTISDDEDMDFESSGDDNVSMSNLNIHVVMTTAKLGDTRTEFTTKRVSDDDATNLEGTGGEEESTVKVPIHIAITLTKIDDTRIEPATKTISNEDITFESGGDEDGYHPTESEVSSGEQQLTTEIITISNVNVVNITSRIYDAYSTSFTEKMEEQVPGNTEIVSIQNMTDIEGISSKSVSRDQLTTKKIDDTTSRSTRTETNIKTIFDDEDITLESSGDGDRYRSTETNVISTLPTHSLSEMQVTTTAGTTIDGESISTDNTSKNKYFVNKIYDNRVIESNGNKEDTEIDIQPRTPKLIASVGTGALSKQKTTEFEVPTKKIFADDEDLVFESSGDDNRRTELTQQLSDHEDIIEGSD